MKIAFDFHGVLQKYPTYFKPLLLTLMKDHDIVLLSGPPIEELIIEFEAAGYKIGTHVDSIMSVVDWLKSKNTIMTQDDKGNWWCDEETWWNSKGNICKEHNISILFDDSLKYKPMVEESGTLFVHIQ